MIHEQAIDTVIDVKRNEAIGQDSLFGEDERQSADRHSTVRFRTANGTRPTLLAFEREMLGLYVSDHPLLGLEHVLRRSTDCSVAQLLGSAPRGRCGSPPVRGRGAARRHAGRHAGRDPVRRAAQGHPAGQCPWAAATLEDLEGAIEVLFFPATYSDLRCRCRGGRDRCW